jgi:hypothetical protein
LHETPILFFEANWRTAARPMMMNATDTIHNDNDSSSYCSQEDGIMIILERLELEDESDKQKHHYHPPNLWIVAFRYVAAASVALLLTLMTPATRLWQTDQRKYIIQVILAYILTLISLGCVIGSNPGYLDANIMERVCEQDGLTLLGTKQQQQQQEDTEHEECESLICNSKDVAICFQGTRRKVCDICNIAPPLRSHHCRICNQCVATFDHHCNFIATCIGECNHLMFWSFLTFQTLGFFICSSTVSSSSTLGFQDNGFLLVIMAKLYLYPLSIVAAAMWLVHSLFAIMNLTTFECGKGPRHVDYLRGTKTMDLVFSKVRK